MGYKQGICHVLNGAYFTHLASNNTLSHQDLSLHAYEVSAHPGLSMSSKARTGTHMHTLSRKAVFHYQVGCHLTAQLLSRKFIVHREKQAIGFFLSMQNSNTFRY